MRRILNALLVALALATAAHFFAPEPAQAQVALENRVRDTTSTSGLGSFVLSGTAPSGTQSFSQAFVSGCSVRYEVTDTVNWEIWNGVFTPSPDTLTRVDLEASSNSNSPISWTGGVTKTVFVSPTARDMVYETTTYLGVTGGSANAQTLTPCTVLRAYKTGMRVRAKAGFTNTAAMTLAISGLASPPNVYGHSPSGPIALVGKEIRLNEFFEVVYNGTQWELQSDVRSASQLPGTITNDDAAAGKLGEYAEANNGRNVSATCTAPVASPGIITWSGHPFTIPSPTLANGGAQSASAINFTTTGTLPTGLDTTATFYVIGSTITSTTFQVASNMANALAGTAVNFTGSPSGTHTCIATAKMAISGTQYDVLALSLTAGDWDIWLAMNFAGALTTTVNVLYASITATSATGDNTRGRSAGLNPKGAAIFSNAGNAAPASVAVLPIRVTLVSTTPIYAVVVCDFAVSTCAASGTLVARRQRLMRPTMPHGRARARPRVVRRRRGAPGEPRSWSRAIAAVLGLIFCLAAVPASAQTPTPRQKTLNFWDPITTCTGVNDYNRTFFLPSVVESPAGSGTVVPLTNPVFITAAQIVASPFTDGDDPLVPGLHLTFNSVGSLFFGVDPGMGFTNGPNGTLWPTNEVDRRQFELLASVTIGREKTPNDWRQFRTLIAYGPDDGITLANNCYSLGNLPLSFDVAYSVTLVDPTPAADIIAPPSCAAGGGNDIYTRLLLHGDATIHGQPAPKSIAVRDSSVSNYGIRYQSAVTGATPWGYQTTARAKFGSGSFWFDGAHPGWGIQAFANIPNQVNETPPTNDWTVNGRDWTLDLWVYATTAGASTPNGGRTTIAGLQHRTNPSKMGPLVVQQVGSNFKFSISSVTGGNASPPVRDVANEVTICAATQNTWRHVYLSRGGSSIKAGCDGAQTATVSVGSTVLAEGGSMIIGGALVGDGPWYTGGADEVRYSVDIDRYPSSSYTPRTSAYCP